VFIGRYCVYWKVLCLLEGTVFNPGNTQLPLLRSSVFSSVYAQFVLAYLFRCICYYLYSLRGITIYTKKKQQIA